MLVILPELMISAIVIMTFTIISGMSEGVFEPPPGVQIWPVNAPGRHSARHEHGGRRVSIRFGRGLVAGCSGAPSPNDGKAGDLGQRGVVGHKW